MGPIALFDKSFLQSLSVDESVWFDHFFIPAICPLFYVETLADLEKVVRKGRSPEEEVGIIAQKVPEMSGNVLAYHAPVALGSLLGNELPMDGRMPLMGGRPVDIDGRKGYVHETSQEQEAFDRWRQGEFLEVERRFAKTWRTALASMDSVTVAAGIRAMGIQAEACKSLDIAKQLADSFTRRTDLIQDRIKLAMIVLGIEKKHQEAILARFAAAGWPPPAVCAPYAAYVLATEIFFEISAAASLIGVTSRTDVAYLHYLPFCHLFVSSDLVHQRCVPHFLRGDQSFVWGMDLKADLQRLDQHYAALPDGDKEKGVMSFAHWPPLTGDWLVTNLWDKHLPGWREKAASEVPREKDSEKKLVAEINRFAEAPRAVGDEPSLKDVDAVLIHRMVHKKKGSWWQLPRDLKSN
jgi:hypothetical protein